MNSRRKQEGVLGLHSSSTREREKERGVGREAKPPLGTNDQTPGRHFLKSGRTEKTFYLSISYKQQETTANYQTINCRGRRFC